MAQIVLTVDTDIKKAQQGIDALKKSIAELSSSLEKVTVKKELSGEIEGLTKSYKAVTAAAKETAMAVASVNSGAEGKAASKRSLAEMVETQKKAYADLLNQLKTLKTQYPSDTFKQMEDGARASYLEVKELSKEIRAGVGDTKKQTKALSESSLALKRYKADVAAAKEAATKIQAKDALTSTQGSTLSQVQKGYANLLSQIKSVEGYYKKGTFDGYTTQIQGTLSALNNLSIAFQANGQLTEEEQKQLVLLTDKYKQLSAQVAETKATQENYHGTLRDLISGFMKFQAAAMLTMKPLQLIRSAFASLNDTLVKTEDAVIGVKRVLSETLSDKQISNDIYKIAIEMGQSFESVSEIATNFARAGMSWSDSLKATRAAVLALNVAELDSTEASEGLIAVMAQFGYKASDLTSIIDKLNKTADQNPVTTQELLIALQKTGSYAANLNLTLEETIGLITSLSKTTAASGQNIGNALKSLFAYSSKDTALDTFASLSDSMDKVVAKYRKGAASILDVWKQLSVEMQSLTKEQQAILGSLQGDSDFDSLNDDLADQLEEIYGDLAGVYDTAGTYRKNYFIALMSDLQNVDGIINQIKGDAADGYSQDEQAKYMNTYTAKVTALKAQWEELANDENGILGLKKALVDIGSALLKVVKWTGGLRTIFLALGTVVAKFAGAKIFFGLEKAIKAVSTASKSLLASLKGLKSGETGLSSALQARRLAMANLKAASDRLAAAQQKLVAITAQEQRGDISATEAKRRKAEVTQEVVLAEQAEARAAQSAEVATKSLGTAINTALGAIGLILTAISTVKGIIDQANEEAAQKQSETLSSGVDALQTTASKMEEVQTAYDDYYDKVKSLRETLDDENSTTAQNEAAKKSLLEIQQELISSNKDYASSIDLVNGSVESQLALLDQLNEQQLKQAYSEYKKKNQDAINIANKKENETYSSWSTGEEGNIRDVGAFDMTAYILKYGKEFGVSGAKLTKEKNLIENLDIINGIKNKIKGEKWGEKVVDIDSVGGAIGDLLSGSVNLADLVGLDLSGILGGDSKWTGEIKFENELTQNEIYDLYKKIIDKVTDDDTIEKELKENILGQLSTAVRNLESDQDFMNARKILYGDENATNLFERAGTILFEKYQSGQITKDELLEQIGWLKKEDEIVEKIITDIKDLSEKKLKKLTDQYKAMIDKQKESLDLEEKKKAVLEAEQALEEARNSRGSYVYNSETGAFEWQRDEKTVQDAQEKLNDAVQDLNDFITNKIYEELESGNATNATILALLGEMAKDVTNGDVRSWISKQVDFIKDWSGVDITEGGKNPPFDSGGVASGIGYLPKATTRPESVNDPELTAKILSPTANAQFHQYVKDMGILFDRGRAYENGGMSVTNNGATTNNTTDNSITINGVKVGSDMMNRTLGEVIEMLPLIPKNS